MGAQYLCPARFLLPSNLWETLLSTLNISFQVIAHCQITVADPECARGGGVSHILAEKGVLASLYFKKCMKMQYFHQERGGGRRTPYAGSATELE